MWDQSRKREKVYVAVNSDIDATGSMTPRAIRWADGRIFRIDQVRDVRPASSLEREGMGDCFTVVIRGEEKRLFYERTDALYTGRYGRWWVEETERS